MVDLVVHLFDQDSRLFYDLENLWGDAKRINEVTDIWTFARDLGSRDPNWKLVATEAAH